MSFVSRALGVHINPIKGQYSGFGNAMRDVAYAVAAYYAAPLLLGGAAGGAAAGAAGGAGAAGAGAAGAGAGAAGAGALTEFTAPEIAAMGGGLTTGAAGAGIGAGTAGGAGSGASSILKYAKLANMMPQGGGGQQQQSVMRDWTKPAVDYVPKSPQDILTDALAKQQMQGQTYG